MKKWIPLFLFLVFAHDVAIDAFDADCVQQSNKAACHMCVCQNHFIQQDKSDLKEKVPLFTERVIAFDPVLSSPDFSRSFFHPPKVLA